jgi:hypothetical protein
MAWWRARNMTRRQMALSLILVVDIGYVAWGTGAAIAPESLPGPEGMGILPAAYHGFTGGSWSALVSDSPTTSRYVILMYRMYGVYCALFGGLTAAIAITAFRRGEPWAWWTLLVGNTVALLAAIRMDWLSRAIGPFELTEYLGLVLVWGALAATAPFLAAGGRRGEATHSRTGDRNP